MKFNVTDSNFKKEVIEASKKTPVLVDFWAAWCNPCNILKPILEKISENYKKKFVLAKLAVEENPDTANEYGIRSLPHVSLFKDGKIVDEFIGAKSESEVKAFLDKNL